MALTKITNSLVAVNAIQGTLIADNAITAVHIVNNAVTATQLADNAVTATKIQNGIIATDHLAADLITAAKIADDAISEEHLDATVISSLSTVTANSSDYVMLGDTSDSNNLKKALVSDFGETDRLPLAGGTMTGNITIDSAASAGLTLDRASTSTGSTVDFKTAGTLKWYMGLRGLTNDNWYLRDEVGSTDALIVTSGGNVTMAGTLGTASTIRVTTDGSASAPCYQVGGDADTGMYQPTTNQLGFTVAGTQKAYFTTTAFNLDSSLTSGFGLSDNVPIKSVSYTHLTLPTNREV